MRCIAVGGIHCAQKGANLCLKCTKTRDRTRLLRANRSALRVSWPADAVFVGRRVCVGGAWHATPGGPSTSPSIDCRERAVLVALVPRDARSIITGPLLQIQLLLLLLPLL